MKSNAQRKSGNKGVDAPANGERFESTKLEGIYPVLDAIAWMDEPTVGQISQFAGLDPRTTGKVLKNASSIGLIEKRDGGYILLASYPYQGSSEQKSDVVRESLVKMPLLVSMRQFVHLGDETADALRKAATVNNVVPFNAADFSPLINWATTLNALQPGLIAEDLVDNAEVIKAERHKNDSSSRVAFLSHSSLDKPFVRQLAADLTAAGVTVWLDEQRIKVGESIPEKISQGLAESDYFLLAVSKASVESEWVKKELNNALINEVQRRAVHVLPLKLDEAEIPSVISDKKYADFSHSYKSGLDDILRALREDY